MKGQSLVLVVLLSGLAWAEAGKVRCPRIQNILWKLELLLPHEDCTKYYQCALGEPVEMSCPQGLVYNIWTWRCDYPENVNCGRRVIHDDEEQVAIAEPELPEIPEFEENTEDEEVDQVNLPPHHEIHFLENGCPVSPYVPWLLPDPRDCNAFFYCVNGERVRRRCPSKLFFNPAIQVCDYPWNTNCVRTGVPSV